VETGIEGRGDLPGQFEEVAAVERDREKRRKEGRGSAQVQEILPLQRELFARAQREKMPLERASVTHKFSVGGHEGYVTVGMYEDGRPGEVFIKMSKEGSTLSGVMDGLALTISLGFAIRCAAKGVRGQAGEHTV